MKRKNIHLISGALVLALGLITVWMIRGKKVDDIPDETRRISVLVKGSLRETEALERILTNYAKNHGSLEFEIFQQSPEAHGMPDISFNLVLADHETLTSLLPKLRSIEVSDLHEKLGSESMLINDGQVIGTPLYEHRFMALYHDKRKITAHAGSWVDLALKLRPLTNRQQHRYGLAMGEDAEHALPFFADLKDAETVTGFTDLALLRHGLPVAPLDCAAPCADALFIKGQAAMALSDDRQMDAFAEALGRDHLGVMPLPSGKATRLTQFMGFARDGKEGDRKASLDFVRYLHTEEGQKEILREFRSIPSFALQNEAPWADPLTSEMITYLKRSTVAVTESAHKAALAQLEPALKPFFSGRMGENEANLVLSTRKELKTTDVQDIQ
jgi:hypothetical protein